ncbi:MAG: hypothetical protein Q8K70_06935 [Bacteroidota bacterium]|nr:hypothetical protein [Bacteroidota bacterium]
MNKLSKNIFYGITIGLSVLFVGMILFSGKNSVSGPVSMGLTLMYILMILGLMVAVALAIKGLVDKPKSAITVSIGVGVLLILILIGYFADDHTLKPKWVDYGVSTKGYSGLIGGSLIATWIILAGAVGLTLFASLRDFIKKL